MAHARDIYMFLRAEQTSMHAGYPRLAMQKGSDLVAHDLPTLGLSEISGKPTASRGLHVFSNVFWLIQYPHFCTYP